MQTKMSLQLYQVDSRTYLLDFRSIDGEIASGFFHFSFNMCWKKFYFFLALRRCLLSLLKVKWVSVIRSVLAVFLLECCKMLPSSLLMVKWVSVIWSV